ncbi:antirestriction protein ArdA [Oceanobacillus oncorhynchi subsp. incaldanensis]|uniref:antirestriction protein ArdA n=1 Tax=Oceanobacillus oncorhynchi TaxID=545501 RepID=UPI001B2BC716|nr:antirestriction protein ArdA [Oceanobacillus oncorhynchi]GIO18462.1 antirestriction protein ArdA [Oceanobacillus oncorhynchi subsp. incaldanensis]HIS29521.1 antirestriction protein ArdA [Candidatus Avamphibacillus intestinigallinarum]
MEMQVYIANLGKYNEGEVVGAWFTPPIDMEDVKERIGLNEEYEEIAIHDYELPFDIHEYTPISEINRLCDMVQEIEGTPLYDALSEIDGYWFNNIEELLENKEDIICYTDCEDMADVARYRAEEEGIFAALPGHLQYYFDFESYGRDLEINEDFLVTSHGVFKYYR